MVPNHANWFSLLVGTNAIVVCVCVCVCVCVRMWVVFEHNIF